MKHVGVIAEYNPFHNGHQYQLQKIKEHFPEKKIIVIMSGDYVQRGEPAVFDKYLRAQCALKCGADIIFELPCRFATASAEYFASAAVLALYKTGLVDTLCFGAEHDDLSAFYDITDVLLKEPENYRNILQEQLKAGISYPKARSAALSSCLSDENVVNMLKEPNNILAIEYVKAIKRHNLPITPHIIKRFGSGYHDLSTDTPLCSASAIRNLLVNDHFDTKQRLTNDSMNKKQFPAEEIFAISQYVPEEVWSLLTESPYAKPLFLSDFYLFLQHALWRNDSYEDYSEITTDFSNRLKQIHRYPAQIEDLIDGLSGRHITGSRVRRALLNILLEQRKTNISQDFHFVSYLRLLGFCQPAEPLLKEMKGTCSLPVINKVADAKRLLSGEAYQQFQKEIRNSTLYQQAFYNKYGISMPSEYEHSVIIEK